MSTENKKATGKKSSEGGFITYDKMVENIPFIIFLAGLAIVYIWNTHYAEKTRRDKDKLNRELKEYRWEYVSAKSELMFKSKQSEVLKLVEPSGLKELTTSPKKIVVSKDEY